MGLCSCVDLCALIASQITVCGEGLTLLFVVSFGFWFLLQLLFPVSLAAVGFVGLTVGTNFTTEETLLANEK